jgi:SAM-dependent methyltransferase
MICPVCSCTQIHVQFMRYEAFILSKCSCCGFLWVNDLTSSMTYEEYGEYLFSQTTLTAQTDSSERHWGKQLRLIRKKYGVSCKLLDIGCGAGYFLVYARSLGFEVEGVEPSNKLRKSAQDYGLTIHESIDVAMAGMGKYDIITMFEVIEHIPHGDLSSFIQKASSLLASDGTILGTTPNADSFNILISREKDPAIWPPSHVSYFTKKSLFRFLVTHGFERERLFTYGVIPFRSKKNQLSFINQTNARNLMLFALMLRALLYVSGRIIKIFSLNFGYSLAFVFIKKRR